MVLFTEPIIGLICFAVFLTIIYLTKFISLGSVIAVLIYPVILFAAADFGLHNFIAVFIALFIMYLHRENIKRLRNGNENRLPY